MVIGIVGKVGSGKSACIKFIKEHYGDYDIKVFSCDEIAKEIIEHDEVDYKGKNVTPYIFFTEQKYQDEAREKIHPLVFKKIRDEICNEKVEKNNQNENTMSMQIIESALPSELMYDLCDKTIYIYTRYDVALERLKKSRDYAEAQARLIYDSQKYYEKFYEKADYKIDNNTDEETFLKHLEEVVDEICIICK